MDTETQLALSLLGGLWGAGLQMTGSKFAGIVVMAVSFSSVWFVLQPRSDATLWGGLMVILTTHVLYGLWIGDLLHFHGIRKRRQLNNSPQSLTKDSLAPTVPSSTEQSPDFPIHMPHSYPQQESQSAPSLSPPIIFAIEYIEQELLWRAEGETKMRPILSDPHPTKDAPLFLRVKAKITAIPPLQVEDVRLEIEASYDSPLPIDWRPQKVSPPYGLERSFHFEIPQSTPLMSHAMMLYARAWDDKNQKNIESTSQVFDVEIRRQARAIG